MADNVLEYYQQISELKKAVRERELHRLELEKQALLHAQERERRHEDFKDKIREIQRELVQREMEATKNFQSLLARVDSIRREHQLLVAHTEQLRHRKLQYEMSLKNAHPLLHSAVHQDLSGILNTSGELFGLGSFQAINTPASKLQPQWSTLPSQPQSSPLLPPQLHKSALPSQPLKVPIVSYNTSHGLTQPVESYISRGVPPVTQQLPFNDPVTSLPMKNINLDQGAMPHSGIASQIQTITYTEPSHVHYKTSPIASGAVLSNSLLMQDPSPHTRLSQTNNNGSSPKTSSTYSYPLHVRYTNPGDIYRTGGVYHSPREVQPATRNETEDGRSSSLDASITHNSCVPVTQNVTHSIQAHLQNNLNPGALDTNYHTKLQSSLQLHSLPNLQSHPQSFQLQPHSVFETQAHTGTSSQTNYPITRPNIAPTTSVNGAPLQSPGEGIPLGGGTQSQSGYTSHHQRDLSLGSLTHEPAPPSTLTNTLHSQLQLGMQYNNVALPISTETYKLQQDLQINREGLQKDTSCPQIEQLPKSEGEITKDLEIFNINDKPKEVFSPRKYDAGPQDNVSLKTQTENLKNSSSGASTGKSDTPLTGNSTQESEENNGDTEIFTTEKTPSSITNLMEVKLNDSSSAESSTASNIDTAVNIKQEIYDHHHSPLKDDRRIPKESQSTENFHVKTADNLEEGSQTALSMTHRSEISHKENKTPRSANSSSKDSTTSVPEKCDTFARPPPAMPSKAQDPDESDTDFFDQNTKVTDSAAYKCLTSGERKGSVGLDSESDEAEGQMSVIKPQTSILRPVFKPFASSIPSLRPAPADTDTESVDSVEAAIQAAMRKKDQPASESSVPPQPQTSVKEDIKLESTSQADTVKPGTDKVHSKNKPPAAVPINLDSDVESYEVSAGGDASDDDDFDFYDKF